MSSIESAVAAMIQDSAGRVLMCQQSQGHRLWGLPGGTIRHGESPVHAAMRDIMQAQIGACPNRDNAQLQNRCNPYCPDLVRLFAASEPG